MLPPHIRGLKRFCNYPKLPGFLLSCCPKDSLRRAKRSIWPMNENNVHLCRKRFFTSLRFVQNDKFSTFSTAHYSIITRRSQKAIQIPTGRDAIIDYRLFIIEFDRICGLFSYCVYRIAYCTKRTLRGCFSI